MYVTHTRVKMNLVFLFNTPKVELINTNRCVFETSPTDVLKLLVLFHTNTTLERVIVISLRVLYLG